MFLVDDLLSKALDAIKDEFVDRRNVSRDTVAHARKAMRRLAASLSETVEYLEGGLHTLKRAVGNKKAFSKALSTLIDQEHLQRNCSESGVCEDLRLAQEELRQLPKAVKLSKLDFIHFQEVKEQGKLAVLHHEKREADPAHGLS